MNLSKTQQVGFIIVLVVSVLTMVANVPAFYSPYSFTVVVPAIAVSSFAPDLILGSGLAFYAVSALPIAVFYLVWSFIFARNSPQISKPSQYLALVLVLLSVWYLVSGSWIQIWA